MVLIAVRINSDRQFALLRALRIEDEISAAWHRDTLRVPQIYLRFNQVVAKIRAQVKAFFAVHHLVRDTARWLALRGSAQRLYETALQLAFQQPADPDRIQPFSSLQVLPVVEDQLQ